MAPATAFPSAGPLRAGDLALFAATVLIWGTTWIALKYQLGTVDPQVSLLWRFLMASPILFALCAITGQKIRFPPAAHLRFFGVGVLLFSTNFNLFYQAGNHVVSGLLSVIFSLASVVNIGLAAVLLGDRVRGRVLLGALLGLLGVAFLFSHEIGSSELGMRALTGLGLGTLGTLSFCLGNLLSGASQRQGVSVLSISAWGCLYGALLNCLLALVAGSAFIIEPTARYVLALLWVAVPGTVLAFWFYLALSGRIGAERAAYTAVLSPVLALLVSTAAEGFEWTALSMLGVALALAGNVLVLSRGRPD